AHLVRQDQVDSEGYSLNDRATPSQKVLINSDAESRRRSILKVLGTLADGDKRDIGYLQAIQCGTEVYTLIRTSEGILRLQNTSPNAIHSLSFVPEVPATDLTCSSKLVDQPVVVTYRPSTAGPPTLISLAIVPRDFKLD
ncbi:MAG TPA: hypothetical protein VGI80_01385, partial [Pyrinomonadaceae bacterium]